MINENIKSKEVRVVDDNGPVGIMSSLEARNLAVSRGLDLVEISPNSVPPVCKIMNYGKYRYDKQKKEKEAKKRQKVIELKKIRLSVKIDSGDLNTKIGQVKKFISDGNRVEVSIRFKGREVQHSDLGFKVLNDFCDSCSDFAGVTKKPNLEGRQLSAILSPCLSKDDRSGLKRL